MKYQLAIFDFDGTLGDSFPFFGQVFNELAARHGFKTVDAELAAMLRQLSAKQIMEQLEVPAWKVPLVAKSFIAMMRQHVSSIPLFPGVTELLTDLAAQGVTLAIVSSNSYDNVTQVLGTTNTALIRHFECGMSMFGKAARLRKVLKKTGLPASAAIYIGDQIDDLTAAHAANLAFGAVAWGYCAAEALRAHSPAEEFANVAAIKRIVD